MNLAAITYEVRRAGVWSRLADYLELAKPRIAVLVLICVAVATFSAGAPTAKILFGTLLGTALVATSASALNQWIERHSDARMPRTADRPLPAGRLSAVEVFVFGVVTVLAGVIYLALAVNWLTALFGGLTWVLYVCVYTPMKSRTVTNTHVGAVAGAMPVLIGWAAVEGSYSLQLGGGGLKALSLFVIVFLWQFPHFMAIAWIYRDQYSGAGLKMLPSADADGQRAGTLALFTALTLIPVSLVPALASTDWLYMLGTLALDLGYLAASVQFFSRRNDRTARRLLLASLIYLPALLCLYVMALTDLTT